MPIYGGAGGVSAAQLSAVNSKVDGLMGSRKPRICVLGNSHSTRLGLVPALQYAMMRYFPADVWFDYRVPSGSPSPYTETQAFDPAKGDIFGVGGTTTTSMVTNQSPRLRDATSARGPYALAFIADAFYNDTLASASTTALAVSNVITTANAALAMGTQKVGILSGMPQGPASSSGAISTWVAEGNQLLRNYAAATQGIELIDISSIFADHATATYFSKRFGNVYQGFTSGPTDTTHLGGYGRRLPALATELARILRTIARPRFPRNFGNQGVFDYQNRPNINVLGDGAGNVQGTNGLKNNSITGNVGGSAAASRIAITDINNGNNVLTPSIVTGADGFTRQRITLSGSAAQRSGNANIAFTASGLTNLNNGVLTRGYDFECVVEIGGGAGISGSAPVTGLSDIYARINGVNTDTPAFTDQAGGYVGDLWPDNTTETLFLYTTVPDTYAANTTAVGPAIFLGFTADRAPSGTIDFSRISLQRVTTD